MLTWCFLIYGLAAELLPYVSSEVPTHSNAIDTGDRTTSSVQDKHIFIEAAWDTEKSNQMNSAIQAGESVAFVCRVWKMRSLARSPDRTPLTNASDLSKQSIFLFCPLSVAYCAQDCLLVEKTWPIQCTQQYRRFTDYHSQSTNIELLSSSGWDLQEVIYKLHIAFAGSSGPWSCSYAGTHSTPIHLHVRDRPVLLSLTSNPRSPVIAGTAVNLTCRAAPSPNAPWYTFIWRRAGNQFPAGHSTVRTADTVSVLTLLSAQPSDDGEYSCQVVQDLESQVQGNWVLHENSANLNEGASVNGSLLSMKQLRKSPAILYTKLNVYHAPTSLQFTADPPGPIQAGATVTLVCQIHGGNPSPTVQFYRIPHGASDVDRPLSSVQYFNRSTLQDMIERKANLATIQWELLETDNGVKFGCAASGVVIAGQLLSPAVKLAVIFPPGPPVLNAIPPTALSENRTRIFTCRSSRGSNPTATIRWRLETSVDYLSGSSKNTLHNPLHRSTLDRLLSGTNTGHVFHPGEIADFESNPIELQKNIDPSNRGLIASSEARLVSRPWYNGARVTCQIIWFPKSNANLGGIKRNSELLNSTKYSKQVHLITEVIFAPEAISLSANPRNGIRENTGQQVIECITTSSFPPAHITWYRRNASYAFKSTDNPVLGAEEGFTALEDPLNIRDGDVLIHKGVTSEKLPGLYGGKRAVSRLYLANISRMDDGAVYFCKVSHIEWSRSVGRMLQLVVLFPPTISIKVTPSDWRQRISNTVTLLHCMPEGGRPRFFDNVGLNSPKIPASSQQQFSSKSLYNDGRNIRALKKRSSDWKYVWTFRPSYPIQPYSKLSLNHSQRNIETSAVNPSLLVLRNPGRSSAGEYTCRLSGPGGTNYKTVSLEFAFAPEITPFAATVFTATTGLPTVLELYVWAFPHPLMSLPMIEGYKSPGRFIGCEYKSNVSTSSTVGLNYTWFHVITDGKWPNVQITSRRRLAENGKKHESDNAIQSPRVWSDLLFIDFASSNVQFLDNQDFQHRVTSVVRESTTKMPTLVYTLFFSTVFPEDYGDYLCEVEHMLGKKSFLVRLQSSGPQSVAAHTTRFTRSNFNFKVEYDPDYILNTVERRGKAADVTVVAKRENNASEADRLRIVWVLIRICAASDYTYEAGTDESVEKPCSIHGKVSKSAASYTYWSVKHPKVCLDKIIEKPEGGSVVIPFTEVNSKTAFAGNLSLDQAEPSFEKSQRDTSKLMQSQGEWPNDSSLSVKKSSKPLAWNLITHVAYQFRLYNSHGILIQATEWFHEEPAIPELHSRRRLSAGLYCAFGLAVVIIATATTAVLTYIWNKYKLRSELNPKDSSLQPSCNLLSAHSNVHEPGEDCFYSMQHSPCDYPGCLNTNDEFYIANMPVIQNPCIFYRTMENYHSDALLNSAPSFPPNANARKCSPTAYGQLLQNQFTRRSPSCSQEKTSMLDLTVSSGMCGRPFFKSRRFSYTETKPITFPVKSKCSYLKNSKHSSDKNVNTKLCPSLMKGEKVGSCRQISKSSIERQYPFLDRNMVDLNTGPLQIYNQCYDNREDVENAVSSKFKQLALDGVVGYHGDAGACQKPDVTWLRGLTGPLSRNHISPVCLSRKQQLPLGNESIDAVIKVHSNVGREVDENTSINGLSTTVHLPVEKMEILSDPDINLQNMLFNNKARAATCTTHMSQVLPMDLKQVSMAYHKEKTSTQEPFENCELVATPQRRNHVSCGSQTNQRPSGIIEGLFLDAATKLEVTGGKKDEVLIKDDMNILSNCPTRNDATQEAISNS